MTETQTESQNITVVVNEILVVIEKPLSLPKMQQSKNTIILVVIFVIVIATTVLTTVIAVIIFKMKKTSPVTKEEVESPTKTTFSMQGVTCDQN